MALLSEGLVDKAVRYEEVRILATKFIKAILFYTR